MSFYRNSRSTPRSEYLQNESLREQASPSIAEKFPSLQSVTVDLGCYDAEGFVRSSQIKYSVNLDHAKSFFRVVCHNQECVRGDFDLSDALAQAVFARHTDVSGEICCKGWRGHATIESMPCGNILRYKLTLGY